jgi:glycosyltransferase involved in cell wall biosynthesis
MTLHVAHVSGYADPQRRRPLDLLECWPALSEVAEAVASTGTHVTVIQAAAHDERIARHGVDYHFVRVRSSLSGCWRVAQSTRAVMPDAIHVHGFNFPLHITALRYAMPNTPILIQDHKDGPMRGWRGMIQRGCFRGIDGVAFAAAGLAHPFRERGGLPLRAKLVEVPATTTAFTPGNREAARSTLDLAPDQPCVAWIGRLAADKDPHTALAVMRDVLDRFPGAVLLMALKDAQVSADIERVLAGNPALARRVRLLTALPRARVETVLHASDVFLSTSRSEGSQVAVAEAIACGVPTVVTDIPASRAITGDGATGALFPAGNVAAGAAAVCRMLESPPDRERLRAQFDRQLSRRAVGHALRQGYEKMRQARALPRVCLIVPGGVDRSGTTRVIPSLLALIDRLARDSELHVVALQQERQRCTYSLLGATVECVRSSHRWDGLRAVLRAHRERPFDMIHAVRGHPAGTTAAIAGTLLRVPVLLDLTGADLVSLPDIGFGRQRRLMDRLRVRVAVAGASRVTVPSDDFLGRATRLGIRAQRLTYGPAADRWPVRAPQPRQPADPVHLLCVADINRVKDHATLLRAFRMLLDRGRDARLDCVGFDTLAGSVERLASELGITDHVRFHGFVEQEPLREFYHRAHILVVSSLIEGDPICALEAARSGVAVAGTHVGHLAEWSPHAAATCEAGNAGMLADTIDALVCNDPYRMQLARAAQDIALKLDAGAAAERVLTLYRELSGKPNARAELRTAV